MKDAKTRRKEKKAEIRAEHQKSRADAYFIVYYDMGPERSLKKLCEYVAELGLRKAMNTLKRYSIKYDWQQRLIEEDTRRQERDQGDRDKVREKMVERHGRMGRTLQSLGAAGILNLQDVMKAADGRLPFDPKDIVSLVKVGTDIELRAAGEPTLKVEITTVLYNVFIARIAHIFRECNNLPTADAREERFANRVDQMQVSAMEEVTALLEAGK